MHLASLDRCGHERDEAMVAAMAPGCRGPCARVPKPGPDSSKEHLGEGGGRCTSSSCWEGEVPLAPLSAAVAFKFNPACCRARERFDGEAQARLGILVRICLDLEPTAADPTLFPRAGPFIELRHGNFLKGGAAAADHRT